MIMVDDTSEAWDVLAGPIKYNLLALCVGLADSTASTNFMPEVAVVCMVETIL
jgi:hypothetical protein